MTIQRDPSGETRLIVGTTGSTIETLILSPDSSNPPQLIHSFKAHEGTTVWGCKTMPQKPSVLLTLGGNGKASVWNAIPGVVLGGEDHLLGDCAVISADWNQSLPGLCATVGLNQLLHVLFLRPPLSDLSSLS